MGALDQKSLLEVRVHNNAPHTHTAPASKDAWHVSGVRCHLIGIGGCGMSGLARMLISRGASVTGSDMAKTPTTTALEAQGVPITLQQTAKTIPADTSIVVASAAIRPDHPERIAAEERGLEVLSYAEALGKCMLGRVGVAVSGTHGKSTTVGMLGHVLIACGIDPTVIIGATSSAFPDTNNKPSGFRLGDEQAGKGVVLAEACEFNRSFHSLQPTIGAVMNVEADHLDIYGSIDGVVEAFGDFAAKLPDASAGGKLLIAHEGTHRREVTARCTCEIETIGYAPSANWRVQVLNDGSATVTPTHTDKKAVIGPFRLRQPGEHMVMNAAFAAVIAASLGASPTEITHALESFQGVDRRMQRLNDVPMSSSSNTADPSQSIAVFDDYGHHPTEIETTLRSLRSAMLEGQDANATDRRNARGRLICVFQPHQHSRTRFLLEEFAQSFTHADVVVVPEIYFVRDSEIEKAKVRSSDLVDKLIARDVKAMHVHPMSAIVDQLRVLVRGGDVLVVMGAGPVTWIAHEFVKVCSKGVYPGADAPSQHQGDT